MKPTDTHSGYRLTVGKDGLVSVPGPVWEAAGVGPGDTVVFFVQDGALVIERASALGSFTDTTSDATQSPGGRRRATTEG